MTSKHDNTGEVSVATVGGLGSNPEGVERVGRQTADLGQCVWSDLDALPVGDVGRRRRVVVDAVADDAVVPRCVP